MNTNTRPVHEVRIGAIKAAIWANRKTPNGPRYSATYSRIYKKDGTWKQSNAFSAEDGVKLVEVAGLVFAWIVKQVADDVATENAPAKTKAAKVPTPT